MPLIVSLNGHSLLTYCQESDSAHYPVSAASAGSSILKEQRELVELINVRKQTPEEYSLGHASGVCEAIMLCCAMLLIFCSLFIPLHLMPWLLLCSGLIAVPCLWRLYLQPPDRALEEIKSMRGIPRKWGLFSEATPEQQHISLGMIDLHYPDYWRPYLHRDLGQVTELDIDNENRVVRQGRFLSLHDEARKFPLQKWRKNMILAGGALLVLLMTVSWVPIGIPFKISLAWLQGVHRIEVSSINALTAQRLRIGDLLKIEDKGMCSVPATYQSNRSYEYFPFDCSAIYWNKSLPSRQPSSKVVELTQELLDTTLSQLHADRKASSPVNPQLASAIQKSGMVLLSNFSNIVLSTNKLCKTDDDCPRLKNALVNLENAKNWRALVSKVDSGKLTGLNVLLRPSSAQNLENLVYDATSAFITRETRQAVKLLHSLPSDGYLLISDQGHQFVDQEQPEVSLFAFPPAAQWQELQRLCSVLLQTPFKVNGMVTAIKTDAHGTTHIMIHDEPGTPALWRYLVTELFLICLSATLLVNAVLAVRQLRADFHRSARIKQYYDTCYEQQT